MALVSVVTVGLVVNKITVKADDASIHFGSTSYSSNEGESFPVGVYINTESGTGSYAVTIKYDPSKMEYLGGADGADTAGGYLAFVGESGGPEIKYMVNFRPKTNAGDTAVSFASAEIYNDSGAAFNISASNPAPITVAAPADEEEQEETVTEEEADVTAEETQAETIQEEQTQEEPLVAEEEQVQHVEDAQQEETTTTAKNEGIVFQHFNEYDWFYVMNMIYSDFYKVFGSNTNMYIKTALEWLTDADVKAGKAYRYYVNVVDVA